MQEERFSSSVGSQSLVFALPVCRVNIFQPMIMFLFICLYKDGSFTLPMEINLVEGWESMQCAPHSGAASCMPARVSGDLEQMN